MSRRTWVNCLAGALVTGSTLVGVAGTGVASAHKAEAAEPAPVPSASQRFSYTEEISDDQWGFNCLEMGSKTCGSEFVPLARENRALVRAEGLDPDGAVQRTFQPEGEYDVLEITVPRQKHHRYGVVLYY